MGDAMRNVTPLYPRDDGAQAASIPSKEQIAAQVLLAMSDKVGSDDYGVSYALKINKGRAEKAAESILSLIAAQPPAAPVETCQHEAIISLDGKWHCQKCAAPIEMTTAQSDPVSPSSAGTVDAIATLMIREMFADHELPVDEAIFHKYEDIARKILAHIPAVPQTPSAPSTGKWQIQESVPSDGFECYYLIRDGVTVAEICGPQTEARLRDLYAVITAANWMPGGAADITAERQRQVTAEGWSPAHDDEHGDSELALAALCYLYAGIYDPSDFPDRYWPWDRNWWKPSDNRRNLVKSGALIAAEIDRLDRASALSRPQRATKVCGYHDGCPPDGPVCHLCEHLQP
jgi:hypothetical protein